MQKIDWALEEAVLLVALYKDMKGKPISKFKEKIEHLSLLLNKRASILGIKTDDKFRNYDGIVMKLENIRYIDTNGATGLSSYSKTDEEALRLNKLDAAIFNRIVKDSCKKYKV